MTDAEAAYKEAQERIAEDPQATDLDLRIEALEVIPQEIAALGDLEALDLSNTQITSAAPLAGLTNLTTLSLGNTQITSAAPLTGLINLTTLDLRNTQITSVAQLAGLANLTTLYLYSTQITSAAPLAGLTNLKTLFLSNAPVSDLRPIKDLKLDASEPSNYGLVFHGCAATKLDPKLKALSEIVDHDERTTETLRYLNALTEWPPAGAMPADQPSVSRYTVPDAGPVIATEDPVGANNPEQQALQEECREKVRTLMASVREGDNELAPLVGAADKYRGLIDKASTDILASALWSAANTLRAKHEAHRTAVDQGRVNEELPPATATALQDLLQTHGIFFLDHPGAQEVERKMREFLEGPRNPGAREAADRLADTLTDAPLVLRPSDAVPIALDQDAARGDGPSAQMAARALQDRLQNFVGAVARKIWAFSKTRTGAAVDAVIGTEVVSWLSGNKLLIAKLYETVTTQYPVWLDYVVQAVSKLIT